MTWNWKDIMYLNNKILKTILISNENRYFSHWRSQMWIQCLDILLINHKWFTWLQTKVELARESAGLLGPASNVAAKAIQVGFLKE